MTIQITSLKREFIFNGVKLADPGAYFATEQVRQIYTNAYPDLATATAQDGVVNADNTVITFHFVRNIGAKG